MENLQVKIAQRAFELFQARGGQHGYHMADWFQAEKEIMGTAAVPANRLKAAAKPSAPVASKVAPAVSKVAPAAAGRKKKAFGKN